MCEKYYTNKKYYYCCCCFHHDTGFYLYFKNISFFQVIYMAFLLNINSQFLWDVKMHCNSTYKFSKTSNRKPTRSCDKLQEANSLFIVHLLYHLFNQKRLYEKTILCRKAHKVGFEIYLPEPVDLFAVFSVMSIDGVLLPVTQINLLHPAQHKLKEEMIIRQTKHLKSRVIYNSAVY